MIYKSADRWMMIHFDPEIENFVYSYNEDFEVLESMSEKISDNNIFDIHLSSFLSFTEDQKKLFVSVQNVSEIEWDESCEEKDDDKDFYFQYGCEWETHQMIERKYLRNKMRKRIFDGIIEKFGSLEKCCTVNISKHLPEFDFLSRSLGIETIRSPLGKPVIFTTDDLFTTVYLPIEVKHVGFGPYVGWYIDSNERFLLGDFTVTHNTRNLGGEDAAQPRYPDTRPQEWLKYVYVQQDFPLLERVIDEGNEVEPVSFLPIIPMVLINGCLGIGTGHSTFVPNCSPTEIVDWLLTKLENSRESGDEDVDRRALPSVIPWYRGFTGNIKIKTATVKEDDFFDRSDSESEDEENEEEENDNKREVTLSMVTTGKVHVDRKSNIHILELPIGVWIHRYKEFLETLLENKKLTDITNLSTHEVANFVIQGFVGKPTFEKLKLRRTYGLTNMVLLDMNNIPRKYRSIDGLLEEFFRIRLPYYALRKQNMLEEITRSIKVLDDKYRFLKLVIEDKIIIFKRSKQEIIEQMKKFNIPEELLSSVRLSSLSLEELTELQKEILALKEEESAMEKLLPEDMWINDLKEFKKKYEEMFGKDMKEELEGDDIEDDDETIPYTRPKKEKKQELSEFQSKKISKIGRRLKLTKEETTPQ
jgi:hypothetical protein